MTIAAIREKLHYFINSADDKKVKAIYTLLENEVEENSELSGAWSKSKKMDFMKQASNAPLFLADLKEISDDFAFADSENI